MKEKFETQIANQRLGSGWAVWMAHRVGLCCSCMWPHPSGDGDSNTGLLRENTRLLRQRLCLLRGAFGPFEGCGRSPWESQQLPLLVVTLHTHSSSLPLFGDKLWTGGGGTSYPARVLQSLDSGEVSDQRAPRLIPPKIEEMGGPQHPPCCFRVQGGRNPLLIGLIVHLLLRRFNSNFSF